MPHARPITVRNPGTGEVLGEVPALTAAEVDAAVTAAGHAQRRMSAMPAHERSALLLRVADLMAAELDDLGRHLAAENGKPVRQTRDEVAAAIRIFRGYAVEATRLFGRQIPLDAVPGLERHLAVTMREPLGVVAASAGARSSTRLCWTACRPAARRCGRRSSGRWLRSPASPTRPRRWRWPTSHRTGCTPRSSRATSRAFSLARELDVGGVIINGSTALRAENLPFGGTKDTGGYREGLHETVLDLTRQKTVVVMEAFG